MRIYTRRGDLGETDLLGGGRVSKDSLRVEAYGTIDELNSLLGIVIAWLSDEELKGVLQQVQNELFEAGADLATPLAKTKEERRKTKDQPRTTNHQPQKRQVPRITAEHVRRLEKMIDRFDAELAPLRKFILPGGTQAAALLHAARTVCRRAERRVVSLSGKEKVNTELLRYLNRLSDLLFVLARVVNRRSGVEELTWG